MDKSKFITERKDFLEKYFECINKAAEDFKAGKAVDHQALQALSDVVRIFGHLDKQCHVNEIEPGMKVSLAEERKEETASTLAEALAEKKQTQLKQTYEHSCQNGTEVKIAICMELNNFNEADLDELRSYFAECSHNYYLHGILA